MRDMVDSEAMGRTCTVCRHTRRADIDAALVEHRPFRTIARQFSASRDALIRHHDNHLPAALTKARDAAEVAHADTILGQVQNLRDRALTILDTAEGAGDLRAALGAIREARGCLELLGKLAGELQDAPTVNVFVSAEWLEIQAVILTALEPHADARFAVADALTRLNGNHVGRA